MTVWRPGGWRRRRPLVWLAVAGLVGANIATVWLARAQLAHDAGRAAPAAVSGQVRQPPARTVVSLTFDDAYENQWRYAVPILRSAHMNATFYVVTADSDAPYRCCMSWAQLRALQAEGDDIGSHAVDNANLTSLARPRVKREVCGSRQDMLRNGIDDPESFAYPLGSYTPAGERIVAGCGFTTARRGGGISSSTARPGRPWAESLPPRDPEAVRAVAVDGRRPIRLLDLERYVTGAAAHGGGWLPLSFHDVCDAHAHDFSHCMSTYGPITDITLGQFLTWLRRARQPGGAPAGVVVQTIRWAMNTVHGRDTTAPVTTALCDGSPCQPGAYAGPVTVSLPAADPGGVGVARTYYTADGSPPNTSSGVYQTPLTVTHPETIKFFSVDNAGNTEPVMTLTVKAAPGSQLAPGGSM